jgi:ABC-type amino acid transport substrate-binding protein
MIISLPLAKLKNLHFVITKHFLLITFLSFLGFQLSLAKENNDTVFSRPLRVVVKQTVPFVFKDTLTGEIDGFSIDLLKILASDMGFKYELKVVKNMDELVELIKSGNYDLGVGSISITEDREKSIDFTQPFFESGLQIMVRSTGDSSFRVLIKQVFTKQMLFLILGLFLGLILISHLLWLFERKQFDTHFPKHYIAGVGESLWWSLTTLVSGGDTKAPRSVFGRVVAFIWMLSGIGLTSFITASLASAMTVNNLSSDVDDMSDLKGKVIATLGGSSTASCLKRSGYNVMDSRDIEEAIEQLEQHKAKAVVFDSPILHYYLAKKPGANLQIVGAMFENQNYGFALPLGSPLRKTFNTSILKLQFSGAIEGLKKKWLTSD